MNKIEQTTNKTVGNSFKELFSNENAEIFKIKKQHYEEFIKKAKKSPYYEEDAIDDFLYFLLDAVKELDYRISRRDMLSKIADLITVISIDQLSELKPFELEPLLKAEKGNYLLVFEEIQSGTVGLNLPVNED